VPATEIAAKWARLFAAALYSSDAPLSQDESPRLIKEDLVFPQGFLQGCLPKSYVQCVMVSSFNTSANVSLIT
jgi:hypothetical protein